MASALIGNRRRESPLWYVAYGANMSDAGLARYLGDSPPPTASRWLSIPHRLYFAGESARWGGGVAFVELDVAAGDQLTPARAHRIAAWQLDLILLGENRTEPSSPPPIRDLPVGGWARVQFGPSDDPAVGKYDAVLRLADLDGESALTITTTQPLRRHPPDGAYLTAIRAALAGAGRGADIDRHVADAVRRSVATESGGPGSTGSRAAPEN